MKKVSIEKSSVAELEKALVKVRKGKLECARKKCEDCGADKHNFDGCLSHMGCGMITDVLEAVMCLSKNAFPEFTELCKNTGESKCLDCKCLDRTLYVKSGYCFCQHWHNFTEENGFCYAFEGVENSSKPVDNSA